MKHLTIALSLLLLLPTALLADRGDDEAEAREMEAHERELDRRAHRLELAERQLELEKRERHIKLRHHAMEREVEEMRERIERGKPLHDPSHRKCRARMHAEKDEGGALFLLLLGALLARIALTIIVVKDYQRRKDTSGLWIMVVILAGVPGAIAYGVCRGEPKA